MYKSANPRAAKTGVHLQPVHVDFIMMFGRQSLVAFAASFLFFSQAAVALLAGHDEELGNALSPRDEKWVTAWTSMPQLVESNNMPPSPFVSPQPPPPHEPP